LGDASGSRRRPDRAVKFRMCRPGIGWKVRLKPAWCVPPSVQACVQDLQRVDYAPKPQAGWTRSRMKVAGGPALSSDNTS
jgi:hypothetical protein